MNKPNRWGFDKGLVSPDFDWFWSSANLSSGIIWEGGGDPYDYGAKAFTTLVNNGASASEWVATERGRALRFNEAGRIEQCINMAHLGTAFFDGLTAFTYAIYFTFNGAASEAAEHTLGLQWSSLQGATDNQAKRILVRYQSSTNTMDFFIETATPPAGLIVDLDSVGVPLEGGGAQAWIFRYSSVGSGTRSIWQESVKLGEDTPADGALSSNTSHSKVPEVFGGHAVTGSTATSDAPQIDGHAWTFHNRAWSDAEVRQWSANPKGPFERHDDVPAWLVAAAPGGGRIMSSIAGAGGLAGMGGIAGQGGGLAG